MSEGLMNPAMGAYTTPIRAASDDAMTKIAVL